MVSLHIENTLLSLNLSWAPTWAVPGLFAIFVLSAEVLEFHP